MGEYECTRCYEQAAAWLGGSLGNGVFNLGVGVHAHRRHIKPERLSLGLQRAEVDLIIGIVVRIKDKSSSHDTWCDLFEQPERLTEHRVIHVTEAGNIAAGVSYIRH